ncbi:HK97-gp10 family putative phage morphogenesis protein [Halobacillus ihumii]|uniref:HK97-gp10 family putative phage morphogenesis protein n=1 Tax=Halobacillus ihumii TaxID=2686092 RepID=UPI0013D5BFFE|nr:HK97-gp10 family putative phage morphogenesis protein [Halobacillus ihumii]
MNISMRNRIDQLGKKGRSQEGKVLRTAGEVLADAIADNIHRSKTNSATYQHLQDHIIVSRTKTNNFGERYVEVGARKGLGFKLKFLEFGTVKMSAQMPMTIGIAESKDGVALTLTEGMRRIMSL